MNYSFKIILPTAFCCCILFILFSCHSNQKQAAQKQYASLVDSTRYVGMNTCRQCHQDKYDTYIHTGMGSSFDLASHRKSSAKFDEHALIYDRFKNFYYKPFWNGDSLYLKEFRLEGGDTTYQRTEQINYIVGSGQHTNSHMTNVNGYVYQVPATYYTQKGQWDLPPGFENGFNSRFSRRIELECMSCHNGYPAVVLGSENKYENIPTGIDCERCHGPGSEHVKQKQAGNLVDISKEIDYTIVNPAKLPVNLQLDVCQRCHIQGNAVLKEGKSFYDFRPGQHLHDVMDVYMPLFKGDEQSHIMASHAERLKMSRCFIETKKKAETASSNTLFPYKNAMTCVTCHDPHVSVKTTEQAVFNNACKSCHHDPHENNKANDGDIKNQQRSTTAASFCTADTKLRASVGDNCVKCHMPQNNTIDIPHVITTDHFIRKPAEDEQDFLSSQVVKKIREFVTLVCINNPDANGKSKGEAFLNYYEKFEPHSYALDSAKKYFNDKTDNDIKTNFKDLVRWAYLKDDFPTVIAYTERLPNTLASLSKQSYTNDDAWTAYRIGVSYNSVWSSELGVRSNTSSSPSLIQSANYQQLALSYLDKAVALAPYQFDFRNKLALVQFEAGASGDSQTPKPKLQTLLSDARKNFEFIINENPRYASAYISLGYLILSTEHNVERASGYYDRALELDPDNEQAMFNKAGALIYLNRKKEAITMLRRLLKQNPANKNAQRVMEKLMKEG